jgi:hypothetical protein
MTPRGGPNDLSKVWRIEFNAALLNGADSQKRSPLELVEDAIPEREFEFRSVALMGDDLKAYSSPDLVDVHENAPTGRVIGHIGDGFRALRQEATSAEVITYARLHGYIVTPVPQPEIVAMGNYVGGVVRVLRSDWAGALELLLGQTEKSPLPVSLSVDALLMSAYCREQSDREGLSLVTRAAALSPSAPRVLKYRVMVLLSEIVREAQRGNSATIQGLVRDYESAVDALGVALGREDTWVRQAHAIQIALAHQNPAPPT